MGNSITRLIVTCSINEQSLEETISSIKFAQRVQKVQTQAEISYSLNKFKEEKGEKSRQVRIALQQAETKLNNIYQKISDDSKECKVCRQVISIIQKNEQSNIILKKEQQMTASEMFRFRTVDSHDYQSPKARIDLKTFMSNPGSRFSSVPRRQVSKKQPVRHEIDERSADTQKTVELKMENDRLKDQKTVLEDRIRILEEKLIRNDKEVKPDKISNKRVIKLGQNNEKPLPKHPINK